MRAHIDSQCLPALRGLAISVKANVRVANVTPELKQAAYRGLTV